MAAPLIGIALKEALKKAPKLTKQLKNYFFKKEKDPNGKALNRFIKRSMLLKSNENKNVTVDALRKALKRAPKIKKDK